jgi:hypothetical protein
VRSINFNVGSTDELDRIESVLRSRNLFTDRKTLVEGATEFVFGRDPDNLSLLFVCYGSNDPMDMDYYRMVSDLAYSLDT